MTLTVSMSPEQLSQAEKLAKTENRTMSELVREALRTYHRQVLKDRIQANRARAEALGIREEDVVPMIKAWRREQREKKASPPR